MPNGPGRIRRTLVRVITDDRLDLYLLAVVALAFTVLAAADISDVKTLSSVVLALLAFSQIRSHAPASRNLRHQRATQLICRGTKVHYVR